MVGLGVVRQAQSNTIAISDGVQAAVERLNRSLDDARLVKTSDDADFIRGSVREVAISLGLAVLIVVGILWLFLGALGPTLIPAVTIPVALGGTVGGDLAAGVLHQHPDPARAGAGDRHDRRRRDRRAGERPAPAGPGPEAAGRRGARHAAGVLRRDGDNGDPGRGLSCRSRSCPAMRGGCSRSSVFVLAVAVAISLVRRADPGADAGGPARRRPGGGGGGTIRRPATPGRSAPHPRGPRPGRGTGLPPRPAAPWRAATAACWPARCRPGC